MNNPQPELITIRLRAVLLGILLAVGICFFTPLNNIYQQATPLGGGHFPLAPFVFFFLLVILTAWLRRFRQSRPLFNGYELLVIWVEMIIGSGIAYTGFARTFLINVTAPIHFASSGNKWEQTLQPLLPPALIPTNTQAITQLYEGIEGGRTMTWLELLYHIPWKAWFTPMLFWSIFILLCYLAMLFIINLLSRQWIHNERLNFPLLRVPQMLGKAVDEKNLTSFLSDKFLLLGVSIPLALHLLNGTSFYFPSVPQLSTLILAGPYFPDYGLFSGFGKLKLYLYPAFIGFAFLTSRQISFSFWFFFLAGAFLYGLLNTLGYVIPASELGITFGPTLSRPEEMQMLGAYGIFFLFLIWLARHHLLDVTKQSFFVIKPAKSRTEWFDVRLSFWGLALALTCIITWNIQLGMAPITACLLVSAFFMITIVATRIICQGGLAYFTLTVAPMDGILSIFGTKLFAGTSGVLAGMSQKVLFVDLRESLMPSLLHGRRLHHGKRPALLLFSGLALTLIFSLAASFMAMLSLCYKFGLRELEMEWATRTTITVYENIYRLIVNPVPSGEWVYTFSMLGALIMLLLVFAYHRFYWWPIHPIGYLTAYSSAMRILWLSFFIGWACNALCMRYGGVVLFKRVQMLFVGLILGDFLMGGAWALVGIFTDTSYQVLPN